MSRWLSSVNNLLEKLDDQVENVRDVLIERNTGDDDDEYYTTESDAEEDEDYEDDDEEDDDDEEEIDLTAEPNEPVKKKLFPQSPSPSNVDPDAQGQESSSKTPSEPKTLGSMDAASTDQQTALKTESQPDAAANQASSKPTRDVKVSSATTTSSGDAVPPPPPPPKPKESTTATATATASSSSSQKPAPPAAAASGTTKSVSEPAKPKPNSQQQQPQKPQPQPTSSKSTTSSTTTKAAPPKPPQQPSSKGAPPPPPPPNTKRAPASTGAAPTSANSATNMNTNNRQQVLAEMRQLRKQVYTLQQELSAAHKEIKAQQKELDSAATIVERERAELKEEKQDLLEDHEEEMEHLKNEYDQKIAALKAKHKQQMEDMKQQLSQEKAERQQEGGDLSQDLQDALSREREALQQVANLQTEKTNLETKVQSLTKQQESLQEKLETLISSQATAIQRQQEAEMALDDALEQHKRQVKQRQMREAELERTIAELGTALTAVQQQAAAAGATNVLTSPSSSTFNGKMSSFATSSSTVSQTNNNDESLLHQYKEKWDEAAEEVETLKGQLQLEQQRCEALRHELDEINQERTQEAATTQERQRHYDQKLEEQAVTIARLEGAIRDLQPDQDGATTSSNGPPSESSNNGDQPNAVLVQRLQKQVEESKAQISRLSEQLLRQQGLADVHKSEILALKGRLQAANARAEEAEKTTFQSPSTGGDRMYDSEGLGSAGNYAGYKMRRRVKGRSSFGGVGGRSVTIRSIRTALNMGPGTSMEGLGKTIDALDNWMIDTGAILRHEPLARMAFFLYFSILHLWCFCLVAFHTTEPSCGNGGGGHGGFRSSLRGAGGTGVNEPGALLQNSP